MREYLDVLERTIASIAPIDGGAKERAALRMNALLKPPGSLGRLEELGIILAGVQGREKPAADSKISLIYAADHGVVAEGVSLAPSTVTGILIRAFCSGRAGINVLAGRAKARIKVFDIGVATDYDVPESVQVCRVRRGTGNLRVEEAMTRNEALMALAVGIETAQAAVRESGAQLVGVGEMGIGNSTPAAALTAVFTGEDLSAVIGGGSGLGEGSLKRKIRVVKDACRLHRPDPRDPIGALAKVGGLEIAGMAGAMMGAAADGALVLIDGFISSAAALIAERLAPNLHGRMVLSHLSAEPGHGAAAEALGLKPLLDLGLRLGEGTGAALAMHLVEAGGALLSEMGTLEAELIQLHDPI